MSVLSVRLNDTVWTRLEFVSVTAIAILIAGACTTSSPNLVSENSVSKSLNFVPHDISGRLVARYQENGKLHNQAAAFTLNRPSEPDSRLQFTGPFGVTLLLLEITPQKTSLSQVGKPSLSAATLDELLARYLAKPLPVPVPIPDFYDWLIGRVKTETGSVFVVPKNEMKDGATDRTQNSTDVVAQGGWHLHYKAWGAMPAQLTITHDIRKDLELKVMLDEYQEW